MDYQKAVSFKLNAHDFERDTVHIIAQEKDAVGLPFGVDRCRYHEFLPAVFSLAMGSF
jgi:hypothetical protein